MEKQYVPHDRLIEARKERFDTAAEAARAMGVAEPTYAGHENGSRGIERAYRRYAQFFGVNPTWLLTGEGAKYANVTRIRVDGFVKAGGDVLSLEEDMKAPEWIDLPVAGHVGALIVSGWSQWPRWQDGEIVLYDTRAELPDRLINHYAVAQDADGRRMLKVIERGSRYNLFRLRSHNAIDERDVHLLAAYRVIGSLTPATEHGAIPPSMRSPLERPTVPARRHNAVDQDPAAVSRGGSDLSPPQDQTDATPPRTRPSRRP